MFIDNLCKQYQIKFWIESLLASASREAFFGTRLVSTYFHWNTDYHDNSIIHKLRHFFSMRTLSNLYVVYAFCRWKVSFLLLQLNIESLTTLSTTKLLVNFFKHSDWVFLLQKKAFIRMKIDLSGRMVLFMKKFFNLITLSLLIKQQDRNFPFIFHVFSNQYYSFESNTPLHSRRYGGKTNAAKVIAPIHNLYLISVTSERMLDFSNKVLPSTF